MTPHDAGGPDPRSGQALPLPPPPGSWTPPPPVPVFSAGYAPGGHPPVAFGTGPHAGQLASVGRRIGGGLIDAFVYLSLGAVAVLFFLDELRNDPFWSSVEAGTTPDPATIQRLTGTFVLIGLVTALLFGVYSITLTRLRGQTLGKMAVGTRVCRLEDGRLPTWGQAIVRWGVPAGVNLVPSVGALGWLLIHLWMIWDPSNQGLHDKAARTIVVRA
jgi:uncharacterized RDD family membrane protein YckC